MMPDLSWVLLGLMIVWIVGSIVDAVINPHYTHRLRPRRYRWTRKRGPDA